MPRLFIGLPIEEAIQAVLSVWVREVETHLPDIYSGIRWEPVDNYHVTLAFLGDVDEKAIPLIEQAITKVIHRMSREFLISDMTVTIERLTSAEDPASKIVGVVLARQRVLMALQTFVVEELVSLGVIPVGVETPHRPMDSSSKSTQSSDSRYANSFWPHITLGRGKRARDRSFCDQLSGVPISLPQKLVLPSITIFESQLSPTGSIYTRRASYAFASEGV